VLGIVLNPVVRERLIGDQLGAFVFTIRGGGLPSCASPTARRPHWVEEFPFVIPHVSLAVPPAL
jgi:hypothetical protein